MFDAQVAMLNFFNTKSDIANPTSEIISITSYF